MEIFGVTFEHHRIALGIAQDRPRVSWRFAGKVKDWNQKEEVWKWLRHLFYPAANNQENRSDETPLI
jgi:hypothetical protein